MKEFLSYALWHDITIGDFFTFIGILAIVFYILDSLVKYFPFFGKVKSFFWDIIADVFKFKRAKRLASSSNIEYILNEIVSELTNELPRGWFNRAKIEWVRKSGPAIIKDKDLILRIRPHDDKDLNFLNAIYYYFSSSIFPENIQIIPAHIKKSTSIYLSKRAIEKKHSFLSDNFEKHFLSDLNDDEQAVVSFYGDYNRIDNFGFFNSAFIREVDSLAGSLRYSHERKNIEKEIKYILNHLKKFENLNQKYLQKDEWYNYLSATSYGFILVAKPGKETEGMAPYLHMARERLKIGIKRLYVLGCHAERTFFNKVVLELSGIKEYIHIDSFKLHKDYRGQLDGTGALFVINPVWENILKGIDSDDEDEIKETKEIKEIKEVKEEITVKNKDQSSIIISEEKLVQVIIDTINTLPKHDGWVFLASLGIKLKQNLPLFNQQHYGCPTLLKLLIKLNAFEVNEEGEGPVKVVHVKIKQNETTSFPCNEQTEISHNELGQKLTENISIAEVEKLSTKLTPEKIDEILILAVQRVSNGDGWASVADIGAYLHKYTNLNYHDYGFKKLKPFIKSRKLFEIKEEQKSPNALAIDCAFFKIKAN